MGQLLDHASSSSLAAPHVPISQRAQAGAGPLLPSIYTHPLVSSSWLLPSIPSKPDSAPISTYNRDLSSFHVSSPYLHVRSPGTSPNLLLPRPSSTSVKCCHNHPIAWTKTLESLALGSSYSAPHNTNPASSSSKHTNCCSLLSAQAS